MQLFLELKDKCRVVSMQAFTGRNRQRESVRGGAHSILQQGEKISFGPDNVSWMPRGGTYYSEDAASCPEALRATVADITVLQLATSTEAKLLLK